MSSVSHAFIATSFDAPAAPAAEAGPPGGGMPALLRAWLFASMTAAACLPVQAAPDELAPRLERQLSSDGVDAVNAYLVANWSSAMLPLNRQTADCALHAVSLSLRLSRTAQATPAQAHVEALRTAVGQCAAYVLALAEPADVRKVCSSSESWTVMQTVRELRRRIAAIEADPALLASALGKDCRDAYHHELHHTRVVLRSATPAAPRPGPSP